MKKLTLTFLIVFSAMIGFSQLEENAQIRAAIPFPVGIDTEFALSDLVSLNLDAGIQPSFAVSFTSDSSGSSSSSSFELFPLIQTSARYYYNFENRISKGKKISGNSANYLGLQFQGIFGGLLEDSDYEPINFASSIGPVWGLQRTYDSNIYLDLNLGLGFINVDYENENVELENNFNSIGSFSIGYALWSKLNLIQKLIRSYQK